MSTDVRSIVVLTGLVLLATALALLKGWVHRALAARPAPEEDGERALTDQEVDEAAGTGQLALELLLNGAPWIDRRKDLARFVDPTTLHRKSSIDFRMPRGIAPSAHTSARQPLYRVPLMLLGKAPGRFTNFDLSGGSGESLALPSRRDNAALSAAALESHATYVLGHSLPDALGGDLRELALEASGASVPLARKLSNPSQNVCSDDPDTADRETLADDPDFCWLVGALADSSVIAITVGAFAHEREIIKLSYDERINDLGLGKGRRFLAGRIPRFGWTGFSFVIPLSFVGGRSYHFEWHVPEGLQLTRTGLVAISADGSITIRRERPLRREAHLYLPEAERKRDAAALVTFRVGRTAFVSGAFLGSLLVALMLGALILTHDKVAASPATAPALVLLLPTLLIAYASRPGSNDLVTSLLYWAWRLLIASAIIAYAAAARLVLDPADRLPPGSTGKISGDYLLGDPPGLGWYWLGGAAGFIAIALFFTWLAPRPTRTAGVRAKLARELRTLRDARR